jgi:hypothetical protein
LFLVGSDAIVVFTGEILCVDEKTPIDPPEIRQGEVDPVRFNVLLAHLFAVLSQSQSMSLLQVNPCKHNTVQDIVTYNFPAIESTDNKPTPAITSKTIGYIHALVFDTLTFNSTDAPYARALESEKYICAELDKLTPAQFQTELRDCLTSYYETVRMMVGAGGTLKTKRNNRKFKPPAPTSEVVDENVEEAGDIEAAGAGDIEAAATSTSPSSQRAAAMPAPAPAPAAEDDGRAEVDACASTPPPQAAKTGAAAKAGAATKAAAPAEATPSPGKAPAAGKGKAGGRAVRR